MTRMPVPGRVFLPNEPVKRDGIGKFVPIFDMRPARRFGSLTFATSDAAPRDPRVLNESLWSQLRDFDPERDYFMSVGNPVVGAAMLSIISQVTGGRFRLLVWDRTINDYVVVQMDIALKAHRPQ